MSEPRAPERTRYVRQAFYRDPVLGRLSFGARDFLFGLATMGDDRGVLRWNDDGIGAIVYPFLAPSRRLQAIARHRAELEAAGELVMLPCGHAYLPLMPDLSFQGGDRTTRVAEYHEEVCSSATDSYVALPLASLRFASPRVARVPLAGARREPPKNGKVTTGDPVVDKGWADVEADAQRARAKAEKLAAEKAMAK